MIKHIIVREMMCLTWSDEEVSEAWSIIAKEGKQRREMKSKKIKSSLSVGDIVNFEGRKSGKCKGKIVRIKRKKAIVEVSGRNWDVPLSMLEKN